MYNKCYTSWADFKSAMILKDAVGTLQYEELELGTSTGRYALTFFDDNFEGCYLLYQSDTSDVEDFENNYKANANRSVSRDYFKIRCSKDYTITSTSTGEGHTALDVFIHGKLDDVYHNDLPGLNVGDFRHLTENEKNGLTGGTSTGLHTHNHNILTNILPDQHHNQVHAIDGSDHTGTLDHSSLNDDEPDKHRVINDGTVSSTGLWSSSKIQNELNDKSDIGHTHVETDITDLDHDAQKIKGVVVDDTNISDGKILKYDSSTGTLVYSEDNSVGDHALSTHTDVSSESPEDGEVLTWESSTGQWIPQSVALSGLVLSCVQARQSGIISIQDSWTDIFLDTTDVETRASVIEHDDINTDRILIKEDGYYQITYCVSINSPSSSDTSDISGRLRKNDTVVLNGSESATSTYNGSGPRLEDSLAQTIITFLNENDFITLQLKKACPITYTLYGPVVTVIKLDGIKGEKGDTGSGIDAEYIQGTFVDDTNKSDGKVLGYNATSGNIEYLSQSGANGSTWLLHGCVRNVGKYASIFMSFGRAGVNAGVVMIDDGEIIGLSISMSQNRVGGTCKLQIAINGVWQTNPDYIVIIDGNNPKTNFKKFSVPLQFNAGDVIHMRTVTHNFSNTSNDATGGCFIQNR